MAKDLKDKPLAAKLAYGRKRGTKASVLAQASKRRLDAKFNDQKLSSKIDGYFNKLRFDKRHHLGLGDIRITMGQQEAIIEVIKLNET